MKRVVFGIGSEGKNTVLFEDEPRRIGIEMPDAPVPDIHVAWASRTLGSQTDDVTLDPDVQAFDLKLKPGETRFVRISIPPGGFSPLHRTPHIVDYLVALSGSVVFDLEDGTSAVIEPGDMIVQLGGFHGWRNEGTEPFVMAGVVVGIETDEDAPEGGVAIPG